MTLMTCIGGELTVYKSCQAGTSKVIESATLSDSETKQLFESVMSKPKLRNTDENND